MKWHIIIILVVFLVGCEVNSVPMIPSGGGDGDTLGGLSCVNNQIAKWNSTSVAWECQADQIGAAGTGDITEVNTNGQYLTGGSTSGAVSLLLDESVLNATIDARDDTGGGNSSSEILSVVNGSALNLSNSFEYGGDITESQISDLDHYTGADITGGEDAFIGWDKDESDDMIDTYNTTSEMVIGANSTGFLVNWDLTDTDTYNTSNEMILACNATGLLINWELTDDYEPDTNLSGGGYMSGKLNITDEFRIINSSNSVRMYFDSSGNFITEVI
ncbi:MAG: hypothetical protein ACTSYG_07540 [Candidatus Heimdallarchaeota archaeon]